MKLNSIISSFRHGRARLGAMMAVLAVAGTLVAPGAIGSASAQSSVPSTRADCANWRSYSALGFDSRADCVNWVNDRNSGDNGYGGGDNGNNGGGLGGFLDRLFGFIGRIFQVIGSFFGRFF